MVRILPLSDVDEDSAPGNHCRIATALEMEMALARFGFIVTGAGLDPALHRCEMDSSNFRMSAIGVSTVAEGVDAARSLVAEGVQLIELCGGFGPVGTAAVLAAVDGAVPVGAVGYGPESIDALHSLFRA